MNLSDALDRRTILPGIVAENKFDVIKIMIDALDRAGCLPDREKALEAVLAREERMNTGMKNGIAIPHGKTDSVERMVACIATSQNTVDFGALDKKGSNIFIMTISPDSSAGPHLEFLAEVSRLFKSRSRREAVLNARSAEEIFSYITEK